MTNGTSKDLVITSGPSRALTRANLANMTETKGDVQDKVGDDWVNNPDRTNEVQANSSTAMDSGDSRVKEQDRTKEPVRASKEEFRANKALLRTSSFVVNLEVSCVPKNLSIL